MSDEIAEAKRRVPLPVLMDQLGLGDHTKKSARCPFHDDQHNSFSTFQSAVGQWFWKCHAGCGQGDEITFLQLHEGLSKGQAIKRYLELAGVNGSESPKQFVAARTVEQRKEVQANYSPTATSKSFDWQSCVKAFTERHVERLAKWRGYSIEFCRWLKENDLVGLYDCYIAFPVHDRRGNVVAAHYRLKDGSFRYFPQGAKTHPLAITEMVAGEPVHIFESQWDAFAFMDKSGERSGIIITRGASNGALIADLMPGGSTAYLWTQDDSAGEKWQQNICSNEKLTVKRVKIQAPHKDLNDWTKLGATSDDLLGAILKAETVQEATPVWSPEELLNKIKAHITRYVVFSRPEHADVIALWILHTWVADSADFTPYIYLHSPVMRCGKTQVHRVVEPLVKNPLRTCNVSEAALYREIDQSHPTLLWDEIDSIFGNRKSSEANENKRALLNAGHERGMRAIRMGGGGFVKMSFDPFCPKILAGIGRPPDTIVDRSIPILIHRRLKTQPCQKYRRQDRAKAKPIHDAVEKWSADPELQKTLRESQPQMPESLTDRQEDIWEPLLAIADSIGGDVPRQAREAAGILCDNGEDELGYGATQLLAIQKVVGDRDRISSADLINGLWETEALPSRFLDDNEPNHKKIGHWLSKFIKSYGGKPARKLRFGDQTLKGYEGAELKQVFDRYCPPEKA